MPTPDAPFIQQIIAPATLIPACGLLLLSSTARMNTVLARIRAFHRERLDVWQSDAKPDSPEAAVRAIRLQGLVHQTNRLIRRAKLLRATMLLLFAAVACNILAMLSLAAHILGDTPAQSLRLTAAVIFVLGLLLTAAAMITSILEVYRITETVRYEHKRLEALCAAPSVADVPPLAPDSGEGAAL